MSYPHIDPKTYLRIQDHAVGKTSHRYGQPRIFAAGSRCAAICSALRGFVGAGLKNIRTAARKGAPKRGYAAFKYQFRQPVATKE